VFAAALGAVAVFGGPQFTHEKESVRPVCPPEKARAVFVFAALLLETLLLAPLLREPLGPHVGQFAEGSRVADDAKFAIDEIAMGRILTFVTIFRGRVCSREHPVTGSIEKMGGVHSR
jgi:hypothetical protein